MPRELWNKFCELYAKHPASRLRDFHRQQIVNAAVVEYGGYGWRSQDIPDVVYRYLDDTNFCDLLAKARIDREERLANARVEILDSYTKMFLTGSSRFEAICNNAARASRTAQSKDSTSCHQEIKFLDQLVRKLNHRIRSSSRFEDMQKEYADMKAAESKLYSLIHKNWNEIPRHSIGFIDWTSLLG